jgi:fucose permease
MYAFRKPFSAAAFAGSFGGMDYKALLVLAQLAGYTVSKFLGIKFVSEATPGRRVAMVLGLIGVAEVALLLFALTPAPWNVAFLFLNGLPLGMVWGLIFSFLEGRRVTEFMALGLSLSLIFASGWTKAAGLHVMQQWGVSEAWMPSVTGALF